ncbi:unnamed protein product [Miscanthus lutarioriparius]|uniref:Uncharacterized protein n=1 Tax=Miscanthus lutarioriparius TaxID=422564 RepID=A0A811NEF3_9POAL|nr:unnamed protein product [Miscanthus lutarioriparius]
MARFTCRCFHRSCLSWSFATRVEGRISLAALTAKAPTSKTNDQTYQTHVEVEKKVEIEHESRWRKRGHGPLTVRTVARYSTMAARFGEVVEDGPEVRRGDLGEPMLASGAEDEQASNGRFSPAGLTGSPSPFAITSRPSWIRWRSHRHGKASCIHACAAAGQEEEATKLCRWRHLRTLRPVEREANAEAAPARRLGAAPARAAVGGEEEEAEAEAAAPRQDLYGLFFVFTGAEGDEEEGAEASRRCGGNF